MIFGRKKPEKGEAYPDVNLPKELHVSLEQLNAAARTLIFAALQTNAAGLKYDVEQFGGPGVPKADWVVKAERKGGHDLWLIWSNEHRGWWAANEMGYVQSRDDAGRYSYDDALAIVRGANKHLDPLGIPKEAMIKDEHEI